MTNATNDQAMMALRKLMADNGLTYADVAELACVSIKAVESWLATPGAANHRNFHRRHLNSIAFGLPALLEEAPRGAERQDTMNPRDHIAAEEAANVMACHECAHANGYTTDQADECEVGSLNCRGCPLPVPSHPTLEQAKCHKCIELMAQRAELVARLKEADEDFAREGFHTEGPYREHIRKAIAAIERGTP